MKIINTSSPITKYGYNLVNIRPRDGFTKGVVMTPWGIVDAYAQGDDKHRHNTSLIFIFDGRIHRRGFEGKRYTPRGIKTKAMQFAKEVVQDCQEQAAKNGVVVHAEFKKDTAREKRIANRQRVIDALRKSMGFPPTVKNTDILRLEGSMTWAVTQLGLAIGDFKAAVKQAMGLNQ